MFKKRVYEFLATWFYTGYSPYAPGTAGTAGGMVLYVFVLSGVTPVMYIVSSLFITAVAIAVSSEVARQTEENDPQKIVIDEVAGYMIAMAFIPYDIFYAIAGFFLFRFFDIIKPFPCRMLERLRGGYGIVLDDVGAGVWTNICLHIVYIYI